MSSSTLFFLFLLYSFFHFIFLSRRPPFLSSPNLSASFFSRFLPLSFNPDTPPFFIIHSSSHHQIRTSRSSVFQPRICSELLASVRARIRFQTEIAQILSPPLIPAVDPLRFVDGVGPVVPDRNWWRITTASSPTQNPTSASEQNHSQIGLDSRTEEQNRTQNSSVF